MSDINGHCLCVSFKTFHKRIQAQDVFHELHVHVVWRVGGIREMEESLTRMQETLHVICIIPIQQNIVFSNLTGFRVEQMLLYAPRIQETLF